MVVLCDFAVNDIVKSTMMNDKKQHRLSEIWGFIEIKAGEIPTDIPEEPWRYRADIPTDIPEEPW